MKQCIFCKENVKKRLFCEKHRILFAQQLKLIKFKNIQPKQIKDYYHNLRHSIMKAGSLDVVVELATRLIALGYFDYINTHNMSLFDKSISDAQNIFTNKTNFLNDVNTELAQYKKGSLNDFNVREKWPTNFITCDGHKVRSLGELFIDNWLYFHNYKHCYEKKIYYDQNNFILSDFYLEKENIYLEYCGKTDKEYLYKKNAQKKFYESLNLRIIYIDYDNLKTFDDFFEEKIRNLL